MSSKSKPAPAETADASACAAALRIGVTGHRRHRLKVSDQELMRRIAGVVETFRHAGKFKQPPTIEIVSALAEGADEIAARVALKSGCRLIAVLPFKPKDYETTFSDRSYKRVFRDLMNKAEDCVVLPGSLRDSNAGYEAVGIEMLERSDVVLTIWDGAPAQGRGGTPDILQSALERRLPIVWIHAVDNRAPQLLQRSQFGPCPRLQGFARRAGPFAKLGARKLIAQTGGKNG